MDLYCHTALDLSPRLRSMPPCNSSWSTGWNELALIPGGLENLLKWWLRVQGLLGALWWQEGSVFADKNSMDAVLLGGIHFKMQDCKPLLVSGETRVSEERAPAWGEDHSFWAGPGANEEGSIFTVFMRNALWCNAYYVCGRNQIHCPLSQIYLERYHFLSSHLHHIYCVLGTVDSLSDLHKLLLHFQNSSSLNCSLLYPCILVLDLLSWDDFVTGWIVPPKTCWSPDTRCLRNWPYLETGLLQMELVKIKMRL